jgi:hypothetical protein
VKADIFGATEAKPFDEEFYLQFPIKLYYNEDNVDKV